MSISKKVVARTLAVALGSYIILQGIEALRDGRLAFWNVSRRFVIYPEGQVTAGVTLILVALLPLGRIIDTITRPYITDHRPKLHPFWRRRRENGKSTLFLLYPTFANP